ncbi:hypothetical protein E8E14_009398 [Neopestalotiopsis sp. 37M]|nr:hypothetical protein E8E14_009398 [Neopestalotiopsis sp. 37M]
MYSMSLRRKPPRKLDRLKCENCRQAKKKCIATALGCARCRDKEMDCPGRTKAGTSSKRPSLSPQNGDTQPLSSSFLETWNERENSSGLDCSDRLEPEAASNDRPQGQKQTTTPNSVSEQIMQAMEEIDGLETGMEMIDWGPEDDGIDEGLQPEPPLHQSPPLHESRTIRKALLAFEPDSLWRTRADARARAFSALVSTYDTNPWPLRGSYFCFDGIFPVSPLVVESLSVSELLSQILVRCDGLFVCSSPGCKLEAFEASFSELVHHYIYSHTEWPSKEVHRDFENHKDMINHILQRAAMNRKKWLSWTHKDQRLRLALDIQYFKQKALCYDDIPQTRQFQDLKELKKAFRARYWNFLKRASESSPKLSEFAAALRAFYRNPQGLCRLGLRVFRLVLAGGAPTTTLGIFAFELLSGAMTDAMRNVWNKEIPHQPQDIDYLVWGEAITDRHDKILFDHLMHNWFPQSRAPHNDTSPSSPSSYETMRDYILNLVGSFKVKGLPNFSAFSSPEMTESIYGTGVRNREMDRGSFDSLWGIESSAWQRGPLQVVPKPITIRESMIFIGAYLFMIYVTERGVLVIFLGNPDRRCKNLGFEATAGSILQVSERLKSEVIDPLLMALSGAPLFSQLLESVKDVVDHGQTWSVEELQHVLQWRVKGVVQDPVLQAQWQSVIDLKCQLAKDSIAPAYGR